METTFTPPNPFDPAYAASTALPSTVSKRRYWSGAVLSGLSVAFLLFDGTIKLTQLQPVIDSMEHLGYPAQLARGIGLLELVLLALYVVPRTATLGAVLWTGFLGGAIATHLRVGDPWLSHTCFPVYIALLLWAGLYLRDDRPGALLRGAAARS
jgi:uncharacterized membrane protein YphA (DoxX/SURF4 family)